MLKFLKELLFGYKPSMKFMSPTTDDIIIMGRHAKEALDNPAIIFALNKIEDEIFKAWKMSPPKDGDARERLYYRIEGLSYFKLKLNGIVNNMIMEQNKIERQANKEAA